MPSTALFQPCRDARAGLFGPLLACVVAAATAIAGCAPSVVQPPATDQPAAGAAPPPVAVPGPAGPMPGAVDNPAFRAALGQRDRSAARVAVLLPLSGSNAPLGRAMLDAAQLAMFELADEDFTLVPFDTEGTADGAERAAVAALAQAPDIILGPVFAQSVRAVAQHARPVGVPVVAFSNSTEVAGDGVFIIGFVPDQQTSAILAYAAAEGLGRFAVLAPDTPFGRSVLLSAQGFTASRGGQIVSTALYDPAATTLTEEVKRLARYDERRRALQEQRAVLRARGDEASLRALRRLEQRDTVGDVDFEAVLIPEGGRALRTLGSLLSYYDVDQPAVRYLGLAGWGESGNLSNEPALVGSWYVAAPREERDAFESRFRAAFGHAPPRLASLAYDATALAAVLAQGDGPPDYSRPALTNRSGFLGVDGIFRLNQDGIVERAFAVYEVAPKGTRLRRPAPTSFDAPIY